MPVWRIAHAATAAARPGSSTPIARSAWRTQILLSNRSAIVFLAAAPCFDGAPRRARASATACANAERS